MTYKVNSTCMNSTFAVPQSIVSNHLRLASGEQIKVLLLILGKAPEELNEKQIAEMLKLSVSDVEDCLQYWTLMGILEPCEKNSSAPEKYIPSPSPEKEKMSVKQINRKSLTHSPPLSVPLHYIRPGHQKPPDQPDAHRADRRSRSYRHKDHQYIR